MKSFRKSATLLEPISEAIFKLEGNKAHVNDVYMAFKDIKSRLAFSLSGFACLVDHNISIRIINAV